MTQHIRITPNERNFLEKVTRAIFANPFSDDRISADLEISGLPPTATASERLEAVIHSVGNFINSWFAAGKDDINKFYKPDRDWVRNIFLFESFHRTIDVFDALIRQQMDSKTGHCDVPFARDSIEWLLNRGFTRSESLFYFALFYQMRRAFYFINMELVGQSSCMKELRRKLWNNVFTHHLGLYADHMWNRMEDFSTILLGETGTGKGTAAAAIGRSGFIPFDDTSGCFKESFTEAFISINLSQYPESLIESELFGHKKGAFTGAVDHHSGIFSRCSQYGAIFLDEIGEVPIPVQIKLLHVLQDRVFSPVGSHDKLRFRGRVIAATNQSLDRLRESGRFRSDFYYRLCSDNILVPPLRQRLQEDPSELDELLGYSLQRILGTSSPEIQKDMHRLISERLPPDYSWLGNVRELEQCIRRNLLDRSYTGDSGLSAVSWEDRYLDEVQLGSLTSGELLAGYCKLLYQKEKTYQAVANITGLDRRTVKKYILFSGSRR